MSLSYVYEGRIVLGCQEGGYAYPSIDLVNAPTRTKQAHWGTYEQTVTLDTIISETFEFKIPDNGLGDLEIVPRLRITIEEIP